MAIADLSVIVTNYNKPHAQIMECMDSIKEQTVQPKEVILVDDCSDDPRAHALAISIILPKNLGVAKARKMGVRMSTGKLLLFVDADDKLAPDFIQQCGRQIAKCDIAYPNLLLFDGDQPNKLKDSPARLLPKYILGKTCSIPVTSMMWRKVYEGLGGFRELPVFEDWDFWIRALCKGYTFRRANTLLMYRQNQNSRNCANIDVKSQVYREITAPYTIIDGKVVRKEQYGRQTPEIS